MREEKCLCIIPLETGTATGLVNQEFSVVSAVQRSTDAQLNKIIEQAKQLSSNVPEIVGINRNFENLCPVAFPIITPHVQYTVSDIQDDTCFPVCVGGVGFIISDDS